MDERDRVGQCLDCRWSRRVPTKRGSVFYACRRAESDPAYPRYPALPVRGCSGYESGEEERGNQGGERRE